MFAELSWFSCGNNFQSIPETGFSEPAGPKKFALQASKTNLHDMCHGRLGIWLHGLAAMDGNRLM